LKIYMSVGVATDQKQQTSKPIIF